MFDRSVGRGQEDAICGQRLEADDARDELVEVPEYDMRPVEGREHLGVGLVGQFHVLEVVALLFERLQRCAHEWGAFDDG